MSLGPIDTASWCLTTTFYWWLQTLCLCFFDHSLSAALCRCPQHATSNHFFLFLDTSYFKTSVFIPHHWAPYVIILLLFTASYLLMPCYVSRMYFFDPGPAMKRRINSVQSLSHVWLFATPWITACQASLSITNSWSLPKLMFIESVMPSSHLIFCCPLLLLPPSPPSIRVFSNESSLCIRWPKYWSFNFSISPSNEHPGLISFRMDWLDLLSVQGTLKSLLQHHSSKASVLQHSAFFTVQLSHPYILGKP